MTSNSLAIRLILLGMSICAVLNLAVLVVLDQLKIAVTYTINELMQLVIIAICIVAAWLVFFCCYRRELREEELSAF